MKKVKILLLILLFALNLQSFASEEINVVSWNVESGGSLIQEISERIGDFQGVDIWGLSEVPKDAKDNYIEAAGEGEGSEFMGFMSSLRGNDRLMIIYDSERFELIESIELKEIALVTMRPALIGKFKVKTTGKEFFFMVNHLARNPDYLRHAQSRAIRMWANKNKNLPIIMFGDFNYDWDVEDGESNHDKGYDVLLRERQSGEQKLFWIRPEVLVTTQCSVTDDGTGCKYNSVLDFIFVNSEAKEWEGTSIIIKAEGDFPDDDETSDYRSVKGIFNIDSD